jgi:hypothetical protein
MSFGSQGFQEQLVVQLAGDRKPTLYRSAYADVLW